VGVDRFAECVVGSNGLKPVLTMWQATGSSWGFRRCTHGVIIKEDLVAEDEDFGLVPCTAQSSTAEDEELA